MNNKSILPIITVLLVVILLGIVSAAQAHDFSVRTSYSDSYGTGIAIHEINSGYLFPETVPELNKNQDHNIIYFIDNEIGIQDWATITLKLNNIVLEEYLESVISYTSGTFPLNISQLECDSTNFISLEVQPSNGGDLNVYDNFAQRSFRVSCEDVLRAATVTCGNAIVDSGEECDTGDFLQGCNPLYGESCEYCAENCQLLELRGSYCGDGIKDTGEELCDDGNNISGDGCSSDCKREYQSSNVGGDSGIGVDIITEDFIPQVWQCGGRVMIDDFVEPGRPIGECEVFYDVPRASVQSSQCFNNQVLFERINNYAFEGEKIMWRVLVMDKNGIEKISDVYGTLDGAIEVNCDFIEVATHVDDDCNARILEEELTGLDLSQVAAYYQCALTVETPYSMHGEYVLNVEAEDLDGVIGEMDEEEFWFFNPELSLDIRGDLVFEEVRPGTSSYSDSIILTNDAERGSGVLLDMFISGTDFYDSSSSGAMCGTTNQLKLKNFAYYTTNGAYSSRDDGRADFEGYIPIKYGIGFNDPNPFYNNHEILQVQPQWPYYAANILAPGADLAMTFRLNLPEPCNGDFDAGQIFFWGEAI
jgi:cysteine-rich repeat protein